VNAAAAYLPETLDARVARRSQDIAAIVRLLELHENLAGDGIGSSNRLDGWRPLGENQGGSDYGQDAAGNEDVKLRLRTTRNPA